MSHNLHQHNQVNQTTRRPQRITMHQQQLRNLRTLHHRQPLRQTRIRLLHQLPFPTQQNRKTTHISIRSTMLKLPQPPPHTLHPTPTRHTTVRRPQTTQQITTQKGPHQNSTLTQTSHDNLGPTTKKQPYNSTKIT